jgi:hypothetical protein
MSLEDGDSWTGMWYERERPSGDGAVRGRERASGPVQGFDIDCARQEVWATVCIHSINKKPFIYSFLVCRHVVTTTS